ncbi:MAG: SGNH/GDSL hydrolase family protein [Myxococcales bacterium]|nr:MAG: SGNH/GDSL hydrolase family protein [Myxococcales bacterium]
MERKLQLFPVVLGFLLCLAGCKNDLLLIGDSYVAWPTSGMKTYVQQMLPDKVIGVNAYPGRLAGCALNEQGPNCHPLLAQPLATWLQNSDVSAAKIAFITLGGNEVLTHCNPTLGCPPQGMAEWDALVREIVGYLVDIGNAVRNAGPQPVFVAYADWPEYQYGDVTPEMQALRNALVDDYFRLLQKENDAHGLGFQFIDLDGVLQGKRCCHQDMVHPTLHPLQMGPADCWPSGYNKNDYNAGHEIIAVELCDHYTAETGESGACGVTRPHDCTELYQ